MIWKPCPWIKQISRDWLGQFHVVFSVYTYEKIWKVSGNVSRHLCSIKTKWQRVWTSHSVQTPMVVWVHEYSIMLLYVFVCHDVMSSLKATVSWEVWQCQLSQNKEEDDIPAEIYASVHLCCCVCVCVRVHVSKTEIEDIIYSLSGRAFVC